MTENKKKTISFKIDEKGYDLFKSVADKLGLSLSKYMIMAGGKLATILKKYKTLEARYNEVCGQLDEKDDMINGLNSPKKQYLERRAKQYEG